MGRRLRILIADDHPLSRGGLRQVIEVKSDCEIVAEAGDGESALESIRKLQPDIAILDIGMPKLDGLAVARAISDEALPVGIVFLTVYREEKIFSRALEVGAKGYVLKDSAATDIVSCIRAVGAGEHYTSPEMTTHLIKRKRSRYSRIDPRTGVEALTPTECRILSLLADCKTSKQIGEELFISHRTVEHHRANICQKLDIHGSHALVKFALAHKDALAD
jgi:DNA-binding NarL/FixJ family response regulator